MSNPTDADDRTITNASDFWPAADIGTTNYVMLSVAVIAQLLTTITTWQLWQVRIDPPNLPVFDVQQIAFGIPVLVTLAWTLIHPKSGFAAHLLVVAVASIYDQFRLQPQILAIIVLMFATLGDFNRRIGRWFLAALWLWAGIHKLLSPHWFTISSHWLAKEATNSEEFADQYFWHFGIVIAVAEILAGLSAIFSRRLAAVFCVAMHASIMLLLVNINWNYSVLPWNAATIVVGTWILWTTVGNRLNPAGTVSKVAEYALVAVFMIAPIGFYYGVVDHGYASVLYSDYLPRGMITGRENLRKIEGWAPVNVPFPCERRTLRQFFSAVAQEGDKLHIYDPRELLDDQFFVFKEGEAVGISEDEFYSESDGAVVGVGFDDRFSMFWLNQWGDLTHRWYKDRESEPPYNAITYTYTARPEHFSAEMLNLLKGLPNLEQLQLANCPVTDAHMVEIAKLKRLKGIGLNNTSVTDEGLKHLSQIPGLRILEIENTQISPAGMDWLQKEIGL